MNLLAEKAARFSLFAESWGTMKFAFMALTSCTPDIFFDTTGCAFTFLVARLLAGCDVVAYVHYPTISTDMLRLVWERRPTYNNDAQVTRSILVTYVKTVYYIFFAIAYACTGSLCRVVMVNSTWTYGHISYLWRGASGRIWIVFPPCDTESLKSLSLERSHPEIVSIGQFRPEKDHQLQLRAFATLLNRYPRWKGTARLILIGSCRGPGDEQRVKELKQLGASLGVSDSVEFVLNQPYSVVKQWFERASVGIHTMWNEHFGIGIVEMMAAGLLVVAHNSGGPKEDIVVPVGGKSTGFLAVTEEQFAEAINAALSMDKASAKRTRLVARGHAARFSDDAFDASFKKVVIDSRLLCT
jgi:alpha-1,2-mannosyltransferase